MVRSKKKKGISTKASIVIKKQKLAYNISISKSKCCSIFTAEAFAIEVALEIMHNKNNVNKDIVTYY